MNAERHLTIGAAAGIVLSGGIREDTVAIIGGCAVAALLPDLDHGQSAAAKIARAAYVLAAFPIGWRVGLWEWGATHQETWAIGMGIVTVLAMIALGVELQPSRLLAHRGPMHSLLAGILAGALAWLIFGQAIGVAVTIGWWSHLLADGFTYAGEPLLWPFPAPLHRHRERGLCEMWHLTPQRILFVPTRWASGNGLIEWPVAMLSLLASLVVVGELPIPWR